MNEYEKIDPYTGQSCFVPDWLDRLCQQNGVVPFSDDFFELLVQENENVKAWVCQREDRPDPSDDP